MSEFRKIVESILYTNLLFESEQKVNWILSQPKLVQAIENRIQSDHKTPNDITVGQLLKNFDNNSVAIGKFLPWVVKMYSQGEFEYTDLGLISNYLENFINNFHKLKKKDINSYKSLDELSDALTYVKDIKGSRENKRDAKANAEKMYEDNKWIILIPNTKEAAIQYGKGTKWCTAGVNDNMFDYYNEDGPLYILINKQNPSEKYQFHFESSQYKNAKDKEINLGAFLKENPEIKNFFKSIKNFDKKSYHNWAWFDTSQLDYSKCLEMAKEYPWVLKYVPDELKDYNMCLEVIKKYGSLLEDVPEKFKDYNMCFTAVKKDPRALKYVPNELKDYNMYLEIVKKHPHKINEIPDEFENDNFYLKAIKENPSVFMYIPEESRTYKRCFYFLDAMIQELKEKLSTEDLNRVQKVLMSYVPDRFKEKIKKEFGIIDD